MFSLTGATKFKYIPSYKDMRGGYDKLHGVVCSLGGKQEEGTAYVFTSRNQKLVKIICHGNASPVRDAAGTRGIIGKG